MSTRRGTLPSQTQISLALTLALRDLRSCAALTTVSCGGSYRTDIAGGAELSPVGADASAEARDRLGRMGSAFLDTMATLLRRSTSPSSPIQRDSAALTLATFLDTPDAADRYFELRLAIPAGAGRALFGATEMTCRGTECDRSRQLSFAWEVSAGHRAVPMLVMTANGGSGPIDVFHLRAPAATAAMGSSVTGAVTAGAKPAVSSRAVLVRGLVSDEKGRPVRDVQVTASPGDVESRTDSAGRYLLALRTDANAIVLTARALGYAPVFKTTLTTVDTNIVWEPQLRRFQLLAARVVTGKGVPAQLSSWRYDELMTRRAQGRGFFMVGNEISSSSSIGDALARAPGLNVKMKYGNTITSLSMSRCTQRVISEKFIAPGDRIGVWVNGIERTVTQAAEAVLGDLLVAEVIALEIYNGASEIPAEFTGANYCGVVSVWTK